MKIHPTPLTAALAGIVAAAVMPAAWTRWGDDTTTLILAFLVVVAFPAHALVIGLGRQAPQGGGVDAALLKRVGAWIMAGAITFLVVHLVRGPASP